MLNSFKTNNYLLPLMFGEIFLLPMWHIGPIPFKFSFFLIIFSIIRKTPKLSLSLPLLGIIILVWVGKIFSFTFYGEHSFDTTIYITINYTLIILCFLYGQKSSSINNFNWIFILAFLFSFINLFVFIIGPNNPSIISFYGLNSRLEEGLFLVRNPGIMTDPNGSGIVGNFILIFWVVARQFNLISLRKGIFDFLVFIFIGIPMISFQSRTGFLAYGIILIYFLIKNINIKGIIYLILSVFLITTIIFNEKFEKLFPEQMIVLEFGFNKAINMNKEINNELELDQNIDGSRVYKIYSAFENFTYSPLFGVGSDRSTGNTLNRTAYHNDWSEILVSTGILGICLLIIIIYKISKINLLLALPFIFPGLTNSFLFTMQLAAFYFLFIGIITQKTMTSKQDIIFKPK